ncbi:hypothetical protein VUR80DRAFT_1895 [Thermomyces stellatus]
MTGGLPLSFCFLLFFVQDFPTHGISCPSSSLGRADSCPALSTSGGSRALGTAPKFGSAASDVCPGHQEPQYHDLSKTDKTSETDGRSFCEPVAHLAREPTRTARDFHIFGFGSPPPGFSTFSFYSFFFSPFIVPSVSLCGRGSGQRCSLFLILLYSLLGGCRGASLCF